jgi:hypothetical protein
VPVLPPVPGRLGGLQTTADLSQGLFVGQELLALGPLSDHLPEACAGAASSRCPSCSISGIPDSYKEWMSSRGPGRHRLIAPEVTQSPIPQLPTVLRLPPTILPAPKPHATETPCAARRTPATAPLCRHSNIAGSGQMPNDRGPFAPNPVENGAAPVEVMQPLRIALAQPR